MGLELNDLLAAISSRTRDKLERQPEVLLKDGSFDVASLPVDAAQWHRLSDVVAVFFDLKSSTNLERGRTPASTASIYDAGVGGVVKVLEQIGADFVDIQGDGGFGLFWGALRYERAMCAAITVHTFSADFTRHLETKWPDAPSTGFKIGVASSPILAKRVGLARHLDLQEPVWAGRAVNYAAKAAQQTDPEHIIVTGSVWDEIEDNDYLAFSCGCSGGVPDSGAPRLLWSARELEKIPDEQKHGQVLESLWCSNHGEEFLNAILAGEKMRTNVQVGERSKRNLLGSGSAALIEARKSRSSERERLFDEVAAMQRGSGIR
jgi:class 3 adenylate cyclase